MPDQQNVARRVPGHQRLQPLQDQAVGVDGVAHLVLVHGQIAIEQICGLAPGVQDRQVPAAAAWGVPLYIAEAFGFRKVFDATFMIGFLVTGEDVSKADVDKYLAALRRAQMDIDLHPEACKHHHLRAVPAKYRDQVDVRAFGVGERIVFLPYTQEVFASTQHWTREHQLFAEPSQSSADYDQAALA